MGALLKRLRSKCAFTFLRIVNAAIGITLILAASLFNIPQVAAINHIPNGSFEDGTFPPAPPQGEMDDLADWYAIDDTPDVLWPSCTDEGLLQMVPVGSADDGLRWLFLATSSFAYPPTFAESAGVRLDGPLVQGQRYRLLFSAATRKRQGGVGRLRFYLSEGTISISSLSDGYLLWGTKDEDKGKISERKFGKWHRYMKDFVAEGNYTDLAIKAHPDLDNVVVDDVQLIPLLEDCEGNIVDNGGFEEGGAFWDSLIGTTPETIYENGDDWKPVFGVDDICSPVEEAANGSRWMVLRSYSSWTNWDNGAVTIPFNTPMVPGKRYAVSFSGATRDGLSIDVHLPHRKARVNWRVGTTPFTQWSETITDGDPFVFNDFTLSKKPKKEWHTYADDKVANHAYTHLLIQAQKGHHPALDNVCITDLPYDPGVALWRQSDYATHETENVVELKIVRERGNFGVLKINYETKNGSAAAGQDYITKSDTVTFNDGEVEKTIQITILHDFDTLEAEEKFFVVLEDPTAIPNQPSKTATPKVATVRIHPSNNTPPRSAVIWASDKQKLAPGGGASLNRSFLYTTPNFIPGSQVSEIKNTDYAAQPAISPNGQFIAFVRRRSLTDPSDHRQRLSIIRRNGDVVTEFLVSDLLGKPDIIANPDWSWDGKRIVLSYSYQDEQASSRPPSGLAIIEFVHRYDFLSYSTTILIDAHKGLIALDPAFSKDGQYVYFHGGEASDSQTLDIIHRVDLNGNVVHVEGVEDETHGRHVSVSPDDRYLIYSFHDGSSQNHQIRRLDLGRGEEETLSPAASSDHFAAYGTGGLGEFAVIDHYVASNVNPVNFQQGRIRINLASSEPVRFGTLGAHVAYHTAEPVGTSGHVVWVRDIPQGGGTVPMLVHKPTLAEENPVTISNTEHARQPSWAANGKFIAYIKETQGQEDHLIVIDKLGTEYLNVGAPDLTDPSGHRLYHPDWSKDGRRIVFSFLKQSQQPQVFAISFIEFPNRYDFSSWALMPITLPSGISGDDPTFSPDGNAIYFHNSSGGTSTVWRYKIASGSLIDFGQLTGEHKEARHVSVSPDGRQLLYQSEKHLTEPHGIYIEKEIERMEGEGGDRPIFISKESDLSGDQLGKFGKIHMPRVAVFDIIFSDHINTNANGELIFKRGTAIRRFDVDSDIHNPNKFDDREPSWVIRPYVGKSLPPGGGNNSEDSEDVSSG